MSEELRESLGTLREREELPEVPETEGAAFTLTWAGGLDGVEMTVSGCWRPGCESCPRSSLNSTSSDLLSVTITEDIYNRHYSLLAYSLLRPFLCRSMTLCCTLRGGVPIV